MAVELIKWFNNHSYALGLLRSQQRLADVTVLILFLPIITRWTSHYLAITRLLHLKRFLRGCVELHYDELVKCAGSQKGAKTRARRILGFVNNNDFWEALERYVE